MDKGVSLILMANCFVLSVYFGMETKPQNGRIVVESKHKLNFLSMHMPLSTVMPPNLLLPKTDGHERLVEIVARAPWGICVNEKGKSMGPG